MEQPGSVCVALPFGLHFWCMKPRNKLTLVQSCSRAEVVHVSGVKYLHFYRSFHIQFCINVKIIQYHKSKTKNIELWSIVYLRCPNVFKVDKCHGMDCM